MKFSPRNLFRSKSTAERCQQDQPPTPRQHSAMEQGYELMELPSIPGDKTPCQLVELRRLLSKHEIVSLDHLNRPLLSRDRRR